MDRRAFRTFSDTRFARQGLRPAVAALTPAAMTGPVSIAGAVRRALLRLAVHGNALRAHPRAWALAAWWRLLGKRVRSRSQMAPLLGASPRAYRLWLLQGEDDPVPEAGGPAILALVEDGAGLDRTLASLKREAILHRVIGRGSEVPTDIGAGWVMPLVAGDVLASGAGAFYRQSAANADAATRVLYADDDLLGTDGQRERPHFKPGWNAELFNHHDYLTGAALLRVEGADLAGLPSEGWAEAMTRGVLDRTLAQGRKPEHVPRILHHRSVRPDPVRPAALDHASLTDLPSVTIIVPTRNRVDLLRMCLAGLTGTQYPGALEIIVIDNDSDDPETLDYLNALDPDFARVIRYPGAFNFAAMNNRAIEEATGDLICLLNNDIEIRDPHWLTTMAVQALRPEVGAVGAQLLYPDGRIQHAGVVTGIGGGAAHAHRLLRPEDEGYFRRHALPQFVSAVTAACLVAERSKLLAVGGMDAAHFAVAFNDVDLCLRLNARGWQSFYEPRASLIHHESVSRGLDRDPVGAARLARELVALKARWGTGGGMDPFHHPSLSPFSERFVVRL